MQDLNSSSRSNNDVRWRIVEVMRTTAQAWGLTRRHPRARVLPRFAI